MIRFLAAATIAIAAVAAPASAVVVYDTASGLGGNQSWAGTLGMDFKVNSAISVTSFGAFDALSDGITTDIFVAIFDSTGTIISPVVNFNGTTAAPGSSYASLAVTPFILTAGTYQVGSWGYNATDQNYNNSGPGGPITFNSFNGKLVALGTRYAFAPGGLATIPDVGLTRYGAGTFTTATVPEPATWALLLSGFGMIGFAMRRRGTALLSA